MSVCGSLPQSMSLLGGHAASGAGGTPAAAVLPNRGTTGGPAQDRSRSPALKHIAGLPSTSPLAPVAAAAVAAAAPSTACPEDRLWYTGDTTLDFWVLQKIPLQQVRAGLALIHLTERKNIIHSCMSNEHLARNLMNYFQGCIRKAISAQEYKKDHKSNPGPTRTALTNVARPLTRTASPARAEASSGPVGPWPTAGPALSVASSTVGHETAAPPCDAAPVAHLANNDQSDAPAWARTCMQHIGRKSMLLRCFCQVLEPDAVSMLMGLSDPEKVHVVIACCLGWQSDGNASDSCKRVCRNLIDLRPRAEAVPAGVPAASAVSIVILHVGAICGISHVALKAAFATVLKDMPGAKVSVSAMHAFTIGAKFREVGVAAAAALGVRCNVWGEADDFSRLLENEQAKWVEKKARLLVFMNCEAIKAAALVATADAAPSDAAMSTSLGGLKMEPLQATLEGLHAAFPAHHMGVLTCHCHGAETVESTCLQKMLGSARVVASEAYAVPHQQWHFHASPLLSQIVGHSEPLTRPLKRDGWVWQCGMLPDGRSSSVTLSSALFELLEARLFQERELDPHEQQQIALASMSHAEIGATRLVDRSMLLRMLSVHDFPLEQVWNSALPCLGVIVPATGGQAASGDPGAQPCGQMRWCIHCEVVVGMLLSSPPATMLTDTCCAWLRACLTAWLAPE